MQVSFSGGPKAGTFLDVPTAPDAFEFPIFGTNGACNTTARYERIKNSHVYEFSGSKDAKVAVEAPPQKSVVIRVPKVVAKENRPKHGHMEWNDKAGRMILVSDDKKE